MFTRNQNITAAPQLDTCALSHDLRNFALIQRGPAGEPLPRLPHYRTKDGHELTLTVLRDAEQIARGFQLDRVDSFLEGELVGYLKISVLRRETFERMARDAWHFLKNFKGWCVSPDNPDKLWEQLTLYSQLPWGSLPSSPEHRDKELARVAEKLKPEMALFEAQQVDISRVDYVRVRLDQRGSGIAPVLYEAAARYLATEGLPLYQGMTNNESGSIWEKMTRHGLPVKSEDYPGREGKNRFFLDFR